MLGIMRVKRASVSTDRLKSTLSEEEKCRLIRLAASNQKKMAKKDVVTPVKQLTKSKSMYLTTSEVHANKKQAVNVERNGRDSSLVVTGNAIADKNKNKNSVNQQENGSDSQQQAQAASRIVNKQQQRNSTET